MENFPRIIGKGDTPNSFYKASITFISKTNKNILREGDYAGSNAKILNKNKTKQNTSLIQQAQCGLPAAGSVWAQDGMPNLEH